MTSDITSHFEKIVGDKNVVLGDASSWRLTPNAVVEIAEIVHVANKHTLTIATLDNSTRKTVPAKVLLDLGKLNHIVRLDEMSLTVHAQAGISLSALEELLNQRHLTLGNTATSLIDATVGTMISCGVSVSGSPLYGAIEDQILGISAVLASGRTINTRVAPRRATGPDVAKLLCGTAGLFGIVTSAILRIYHQPDTRFVVAHRLPDFESAFNAAHLLLREEAAPECLQILDAATASKDLNIRINPNEVLLLAATAGPTDLAACDRDLVVSASKACGGADAGGQIAERWWATRHKTAQKKLGCVQIRIATTTKPRPPIYEAITELAKQLAINIGVITHHISATAAVFTVTLPNSVIANKSFSQARTAFAQMAANSGAIIVGESSKELSQSLETLQKQLDPNQILCPVLDQDRTVSSL